MEDQPTGLFPDNAVDGMLVYCTVHRCSRGDWSMERGEGKRDQLTPLLIEDDMTVKVVVV
jgi:hypothetical protein